MLTHAITHKPVLIVQFAFQHPPAMPSVSPSSVAAVPVFFPEDSARQWLETIDCHARLFGWPQTAKLDVARCRLGQEARTWEAGVRQQTRTWDSFCVAFLQRYGVRTDELHTRLANCRQKRDETVRSYCDRFRHLLSELGINGDADVTHMHNFMRGLNSTVRVQTHLGEPHTLSRAIELAIYISEVLRNENAALPVMQAAPRPPNPEPARDKQVRFETPQQEGRFNQNRPPYNNGSQENRSDRDARYRRQDNFQPRRDDRPAPRARPDPKPVTAADADQLASQLARLTLLLERNSGTQNASPSAAANMYETYMMDGTHSPVGYDCETPLLSPRSYHSVDEGYSRACLLDTYPDPLHDFHPVTDTATYEDACYADAYHADEWDDWPGDQEEMYFGEGYDDYRVSPPALYDDEAIYTTKRVSDFEPSRLPTKRVPVRTDPDTMDFERQRPYRRYTSGNRSGEATPQPRAGTPSGAPTGVNTPVRGAPRSADAPARPRERADIGRQARGPGGADTRVDPVPTGIPPETHSEERRLATDLMSKVLKSNVSVGVALRCDMLRMLTHMATEATQVIRTNANRRRSATASPTTVNATSGVNLHDTFNIYDNANVVIAGAGQASEGDTMQRVSGRPNQHPPPQHHHPRATSAPPQRPVASRPPPPGPINQRQPPTASNAPGARVNAPTGPAVNLGEVTPAGTMAQAVNASDTSQRSRYQVCRATVHIVDVNGENMSVAAVIDSGASSSVITLNTLRRLGLAQYIEKESVEFLTASGTKATSAGRIKEVRVSLGDMTFTLDMLVSTALNYGVLLGCDFLWPIQATICYQRNHLLYNNDRQTRSMIPIVYVRAPEIAAMTVDEMMMLASSPAGTHAIRDQSMSTGDPPGNHARPESPLAGDRDSPDLTAPTAVGPADPGATLGITDYPPVLPEPPDAHAPVSTLPVCHTAPVTDNTNNSDGIPTIYLTTGLRNIAIKPVKVTRVPVMTVNRPSYAPSPFLSLKGPQCDPAHATNPGQTCGAINPAPEERTVGPIAIDTAPFEYPTDPRRRPYEPPEVRQAREAVRELTLAHDTPPAVPIPSATQAGPAAAEATQPFPLAGEPRTDGAAARQAERKARWQRACVFVRHTLLHRQTHRLGSPAPDFTPAELHTLATTTPDELRSELKGMCAQLARHYPASDAIPFSGGAQGTRSNPPEDTEVVPSPHTQAASPEDTEWQQVTEIISRMSDDFDDVDTTGATDGGNTGTENPGTQTDEDRSHKFMVPPTMDAIAWARRNGFHLDGPLLYEALWALFYTGAPDSMLQATHEELSRFVYRLHDRQPTVLLHPWLYTNLMQALHENVI